MRRTSAATPLGHEWVHLPGRSSLLARAECHRREGGAAETRRSALMVAGAGPVSGRLARIDAMPTGLGVAPWPQTVPRPEASTHLGRPPPGRASADMPATSQLASQCVRGRARCDRVRSWRRDRTSAIRRRRRGVRRCERWHSSHHTWLSGPNARYGFSIGGSGAVAIKDEQVRPEIRAFLSGIGPLPGYLAE